MRQRLMDEMDRPYMQLLATAGIILCILVTLWYVGFTNTPSPLPPQATEPPVASSYTQAPPCARAMDEPTDAQCDTYHARLTAQGFEQISDNSYVRPPR